MTKRTQLSKAVAAALLLLSGVGTLAFAATEAEPEGTIGANDTIQTAELLDYTAADCPPPPAPVVPGQNCSE